MQKRLNIKKRLGGALLFLFPVVKCIACQREDDLSARGLCRQCEEDLSGSAGVFHKKNASFSVYAPYLYDNTAAMLVKNLKFRRIGAAALPLASQMAKLIAQEGVAADLVVPVPVSKKRLRERGFNQSELMAKRICGACGMPLVPGVLMRLRHTKEQAGLDVLERYKNVFNAFRASGVRGKTVLLIDDVYTTGATSGECIKALLEAGALNVTVVCATMAKLE